MKNQKDSQTVTPHQIKGEGGKQGPAFRHPLQDEEWSDGNGY